jgi:cell division protein FtsL
MMNHMMKIFQKVRQAPWRMQRQWIGLFMLGVVLAAMVAGIYLNVTARAEVAGRNIQLLEAQISSNQIANADLENQLAALYSPEVMQQRAQALGFQPATSDDILYVAVPGSVIPQPVDMSSPSNAPVPAQMQPQYTETLLDWFLIQLAGTPGGQP